jgi:Family of unknown function (DUF6326)
MDDVRIKLSALWVAVMLTYLLGDVVRLYAGDVRPGEIGGKPIPPVMYLGIAAFMVIPVVMVVLSVTLNQPVDRWVNIIVAIIFFLFNLVGLPTYPGAYDKFLLFVSLVFNAMTLWYAWKWV